jgi:hypothetical protein
VEDNPVESGVVECSIHATNHHRDWEGRDVVNVNQEVEVTGETYVGATVNR